MTYKTLMIIISAFVVIGGSFLAYKAFTEDPKADPEALEVTMYRGEACECCVDWAEYLEDEGFTVLDEKVEHLQQVKQQENIAPAMQSCHTAIVDGYVVEGHVPADDILRMVAQQPDAIGIAVPGMPAGSPGMEIGHSEPYNVLLFDRERYSVFAEY